MPQLWPNETQATSKTLHPLRRSPLPRSYSSSAYVNGTSLVWDTRRPSWRVIGQFWGVLWGGEGDLPDGLKSRQPESKNGTTTSALLWSNLRNVCTFFSSDSDFFLSFSCLFLFIFGFLRSVPPYLKVWPMEEAGTGTGWWPRPLTLHPG